MHDGMEEIVKDFLIESTENLDNMDRDFVTLETDPTNAEVIARIFRAIHTIKGTCGFFGFSKLESVSHAGENLLSRLRDKEFVITSEMTSDLLKLIDVVREILASIETNATEGDGDYSAVVAAISRHLPAQDSAPEEAFDGPVVEPAIAGQAGSGPDDDSESPIGITLVREGKVSAQEVEAALEQQRAGDPRHVGEILVERGAISSDEVVDALRKKEQSAASSAAESSIRVDVRLLDKLMNMVGELVLGRNQILQFSLQTEDANFLAAAQRLNLITTELQEGVMKTRMQPIGNVWNKFPRVVRDVSTSLGKKVRLVMEGQETELDKTVLEAIKDPLTHIVRNSVDHGIEVPADRKKAGKLDEGVLRLRAFHESGHVVIEIADDGHGIDPGRVRDKAIKSGLITGPQAATMSEREFINMVFLPGFSTAAAVTNISGRGVGMDVVRTNIEKIGGSIDLQSDLGKGTTIKIKIPLTLAIIPALVVTCGDERYAIPQVNLLELVRLDQKEARRGIEHVHGCPVYRLRGKLLPLVYLRQLLQLEGGPESDDGIVNIVVVQAEDRQFGLVVETVLDTEEIVVKPLGNQLKQLAVFAGTAIMGDGRIALIVDVVGVAHAGGLTLKSEDRGLQSDLRDADSSVADAISLLLVRAGGGGPMAIPLSTVSRLEEFEFEKVEAVGESDVIQYREQILPLFHIASILDGQRIRVGNKRGNASESDRLKIVVYSENGRDVGLVVDEILDITDERVSIAGASSRAGVISTAVIQGRVTEVLDMQSIIRQALPAQKGPVQ